MISAFLDTNVLWPNMRRNFLLALAVESAYRPLWSNAILDELQEHEAMKLVRRHSLPAEAAAARAAQLVSEMRRGFPDALVTGWEAREGTFGLPDPDDEHVLAAADTSGATALVTVNMKDFPRAAVPVTIVLMQPEEFARAVVSESPILGLRAAESIVAFSGRRGLPARSLDAVFAQLADVYDMGDSVRLMREAQSWAPGRSGRKG